MSVADERSVVPPPSAAPRSPRVPQPVRYVAPAPAPRRRAGSDAGKALAVAFGVAWLTMLLVEPVPAGDVHIPLWQIPIELAALGTIVAVVIALWRGSRRAPRLGLAAGALMAVGTMACHLAGHTPVGWWTWVQAGLALAVMATSAALHGRVPARPGG